MNEVILSPLDDQDDGGPLCMDGYDNCIIGIVDRFGQPPIICYDRAKVIEKLMADGMTEEEAEEFWSFNQIGAWMGPRTPCFLSRNRVDRETGGETK
jgi:hypothetical protein